MSWSLDFSCRAAGEELTLDRQARAGLSYQVHANWLAAADFDLLRSRDAFGERRDIALGVEGKVIGTGLRPLGA